jgi:hypothetical protein
MDPRARWQDTVRYRVSFRPGEFCQSQVTIDRMLVRVDRGDAMVEPLGTFASVSQAEPQGSWKHLSHERAPKQALKIEHQIDWDLTEGTIPLDRVKNLEPIDEIASGKSNNSHQIEVAVQNWPQFRIYDPTDLELRKRSL